MSSNKSLLNKLAQLQCANEKKVNLEQCQAKHLRGYPDCFSAADAPRGRDLCGFDMNNCE